MAANDNDREYLKTHNIAELFEELTLALLKTKSDKPIQHLKQLIDSKYNALSCVEDKLARSQAEAALGPPNAVTTGFKHKSNPYTDELKGVWGPRATKEVAAGIPFLEISAADFNKASVEDNRKEANERAAAMKDNEANKKWAEECAEPTEVTIDTSSFPPCDNKELKVFVFTPKAGGEGEEKSKKRPAVVFAHGGNGVFHSAEHYNHFAAKFASSCDCVVFNVDYRLAPETKMPGAAYDIAGVTLAIQKDAEKYGIDPAKIVLAGHGSTAATVAAYDLTHKRAGKLPEGTKPPVGVISISPQVTDQFLHQDRVMPVGAELAVAPFAVWFDNQLTSDAILDDSALLYVNCMSDEALAVYPKTVLLTGEFDAYRRPAEEFAERLDKAGRLGAFICYPGVAGEWELSADYEGVDKFWVDAKKCFDEIVSA